MQLELIWFSMAVLNNALRCPLHSQTDKFLHATKLAQLSSDSMDVNPLRTNIRVGFASLHPKVRRGVSGW